MDNYMAIWLYCQPGGTPVPSLVPGGDLMTKLTPQLMEIVAERFRVLGEPMRIRILDALRQRERTVNDLVAATGATQANISKHLTLLHRLRFGGRRQGGGAGFSPAR